MLQVEANAYCCYELEGCSHRSLWLPLQVALKAATKQLGDAKVCVDGYEGGLVTHMLVGSETRTFKMLLAVANGAWLLQPQWLHDSLAAGCWQAEEAYKLQSRCGARYKP